MLLAGLGMPNVESVAEGADAEVQKNQLIVQQVKITDLDGNLKAVFPSKTDLQFDENLSILVDREGN